MNVLRSPHPIRSANRLRRPEKCGFDSLPVRRAAVRVVPRPQAGEEWRSGDPGGELLSGRPPRTPRYAAFFGVGQRPAWGDGRASGGL